MAKLILIHDNAEVGEWALTETPLIVGCGEGTQITIDSVYVSEKHCLIGMGQKGYIFDLGTQAGTYVNGEKVLKSILNSGDTIDFGRHRIVYVERPEERQGKAEEDYDSTLDDESEEDSEESGVPWVLSVSDNEGERKIYLTEPVCVLGSSDECDVTLNGKKISDKHGAFIKDSFGLRLVNVSNKKKLFVNGQLADVRTVLSVDDRISIGTAEISVKQE